MDSVKHMNELRAVGKEAGKRQIKVITHFKNFLNGA